MKAFLIVLVVFITFPLFSVHGQDMIDVIYKNNGDILKGLIIETVPNDYIRIELKDGSVFTVKYSEIAKITKEKTTTTTEAEHKKEGGPGLMFTLLGGADFSGDEPIPGVGFRFGGAPIKDLYVGATVVTHFGEDNSATYFGAEIGYSSLLEVLIVQTYISLGGIANDEDTNFYIGGAIALYYSISESFRIGADFKYLYVPDTEKYAFPLYLGLQFAW